MSATVSSWIPNWGSKFVGWEGAGCHVQGSHPLGRQRLAALSQGERGEVLDALVHLRLGEGGQQLPQLVLHGEALGDRLDQTE